MIIYNYEGLNVLHVIFENQFLLTSTLMRMQEFYESNLDNIRNKYFTLEKLIHEYSKAREYNFDYFTNWSGFNFPDYNLKEFTYIFGDRNDISEKEQSFIDLIKNTAEKLEFKKFYIIATYENDSEIEEEDTNTINHELAHAMYYLNEEYMTSMDNIVDKFEISEFEYFYETLFNYGYADEVIYDEIQAYFATFNDFSEFKESFLSYDIDESKINAFKDIFDKAMITCSGKKEISI